MRNIFYEPDSKKFNRKIIYIAGAILALGVGIYIHNTFHHSEQEQIAEVADTKSAGNNSANFLKAMGRVPNSVSGPRGKTIIQEKGQEPVQRRAPASPQAAIAAAPANKNDALMKALNSPLSLDTSAGIRGSERKDMPESAPSTDSNSSVASAGYQPPATAYDRANNQSGKRAFLDQKDTSPDSLKNPPYPQVGKYKIMAGSIIPAALQTGINSDLPGEIIARIRENVYDTRSGAYLLLPQGATLIGSYDSQIAYGQSRVLMAWNRIVFPNGESLRLDGMPGADLAGMAGMEDLVNNHYIKTFGSAILMSIFTAGAQMSAQGFWNNSTKDSTYMNAGQIMAGALGQNINEAAMKLIEKNMNIQPTIEIRPGCRFNVLVTRDIPFKHPYKVGT